ncbi:MAG TPA: PAS domain S-box protein [Acidobacteriaceae bacterium]|jgi:PAS domain S-box-containing protein|nr:PAS domain S-box protein [Acidobacteriaceae bacterium]
MNGTLPQSDITRSESLRLETLERYRIVDSPSDPALDDLTELAAKVCNTPVAGISFTTQDHIWIHAHYGMREVKLPIGALPASPPFRTHSVYEIPDARSHTSFAPSGITISGRTYFFYAAAPLITPSGVRIGSLFLLDAPTRRLTPFQLQTLTILGRQAMAVIELNHSMRQMEGINRSYQKMESALTVERNFVSTVLDTVDALVAVFDPAGRIVRFNRACEAASGYDVPSLIGRFVWDKLIPHADIPAAQENFARLRAEGVPLAFENQWVHRDGGIRRIAWSASPLLNDRGEVSFIIATGIDVTIQRAAEATLRESEARYRQLVEGSLGMVCTHDLSGTLLSVNTHGAQSIGISREHMVGHRLSDFMPDRRKPAFDKYLADIVRKGEVQGLLHLIHADGEERVIAYRNKLIEIPGRDPYVLGFGVDITEQIRAEEKLRTLSRQSNSVLESVGDGIYGLDLEGRVTVVNPAASQMLGFKPDELLGRHMHELIHHSRPDGTPLKAEDCHILRTLRDLNTVRISNEVFWRKDGTSFPVEYVARPQIETVDESEIETDPNAPAADPWANPGTERGGKAVGIVVAFTDTTERRALDRMKDEFVSTVSHELRTPLTSLRAALGLITGGSLSERPEKFRQMLDIATGNTDRLVRLVNDILELERIGSGKTELRSTMCSADDLFRRAVGLQQMAAAKGHLRITFNSQGVEVWADPDRILQTLTNLISNAIKFSPPNTEIHLRAVHLDASEAEIQVRDHGRGIPEDKLESIFERFHQVDASDSRTMGGTGLGLAICRSIIQQHGGRIWATSTLGKGSAFHFTLPIKPAGNLL